jgi:hypothetical protein
VRGKHKKRIPVALTYKKIKADTAQIMLHNMANQILNIILDINMEEYCDYGYGYALETEEFHLQIAKRITREIMESPRGPGEILASAFALRLEPFKPKKQQIAERIRYKETRQKLKKCEGDLAMAKSRVITKHQKALLTMELETMLFSLLKVTYGRACAEVFKGNDNYHEDVAKEMAKDLVDGYLAKRISPYLFSMQGNMIDDNSPPYNADDD